MKIARLCVALSGCLSLLVACGGDPAQEFAAGAEAGKGDYFWADSGPDEGCYYNWQCDSEQDLVCLPRYNFKREVVERKCKPRSTTGLPCDEDADCADSSHRCITASFTRACMKVDPDHPECIEDHFWCEDDLLKMCLAGYYQQRPCEDEGRICRDNVEIDTGVFLSTCIKPEQG